MLALLKNLSGIPLDVPTLAGPDILPANGELIADLSAYELEVMRHSPLVEVSDADEPAETRPAKKAKA